MRKGLLMAFAVLMLASSAWAGTAYIGVWGTPYDESGDPHSICRLDPVIYADIFVVWIWIFPSSLGMNACEFKLSVPAGFTWETNYPDPDTAGEMVNPAITIELGSLTSGISSAFGSCQVDWTWIHKRWYSSKNVTPKYMSIVAHPSTSKISVASCELGNPMYDATVFTHLHFYQDCVVGTQESTWGAIKSMF